MSSERFRVLVLSFFLMALIVFGLAYRPTDAFSRPAPNSKTGETHRIVPRR